jgi:hypothetical protein
VRMIACPGCGRHTNPASGPCTKCATLVCGECQLILLDDERHCPRCGYKVSASTYPDLGQQSLLQ